MEHDAFEMLLEGVQDVMEELAGFDVDETIWILESCLEAARQEKERGTTQN